MSAKPMMMLRVGCQDSHRMNIFTRHSKVSPENTKNKLKMSSSTLGSGAQQASWVHKAQIPKGFYKSIMCSCVNLQGFGNDAISLANRATDPKFKKKENLLNDRALQKVQKKNESSHTLIISLFWGSALGP